MKKLSYRAVLSIICSAILFCMPVGAYFANSNHAISVMASDDMVESEDIETTSEAEDKNEDNTKEDETNQPSEDEEQSEEATAKCTCGNHCSQYGVNAECEVCSANYKDCKYVNPNVVITIGTANEWYKTSAKVQIDAQDTLSTGNFVVAKMEAKIGQSGSWSDITESKYVDISENCSVYVKVTDQKGNTYEKNRALICFDTTKPTLNAAISDGLLSVQASDTDSGVKAVYVNGYEFTNLTNGTLNIRLQQFDTGYQYFTIQAMDNAGNVSDTYKTANPYYTDPTKEDSSGNSNQASNLPVNAQATAPNSAKANVTEHSVTDSSGNVTETTKESAVEANSKAASSTKANLSEDENSEKTQYGKEFYTIETASEKVFYLIVDRDGDEEVVYFLTEISENDLLNAVESISETLPKNSAALDNGIPTDSALPNNNVEAETSDEITEEGGETEALEDGESEEDSDAGEKTPIQESTVGTYILFGVLGVAVLGAMYFLKFKKKKEDYMDEEDDEDIEPEEFENEDDESDEDDLADDDSDTSEIDEEETQQLEDEK